MSLAQVLVVEDDDALRGVIALLLRDEGYQVVEFPNGRQAIDWLRGKNASSEGPWVVVLDLMMPVMTGEEFLKELEATGLTGSVGVVIMTTNTKWRGEGVAVLRKPFLSNALVERIVELIQELRPPQS